MPRYTGVVLGMLLLAHGRRQQFTQQGPKLVGTDGGGGAWLSGRVGGGLGGWQYGHRWWGVRRQLQCRCCLGVHAQWRGVVAAGQQAGRRGRYRGCQQGAGVAISGDGNTAIVGGPDDNWDAGAAWVYTRSVGVWSQQGSKLVGTGAVGLASRAVRWRSQRTGTLPSSADRRQRQSTGSGAAWVFTRSGGVWSQQGSKLVGSGAVGAAKQGYRWGSRRTATLPSSAGRRTTPGPAPRGCTRAAGGCGRSRGASWSARAPSGPPSRAGPWRFRGMGTPP